MKKVLLLLSLLFSCSLFAQNYTNICSPGTTFFKDMNGNMMAFRRDSVLMPSSQDSLFISYRTIIETEGYGCYDTTSGSILGLKVYEKPDGIFLFFNKNSDTVTVKTQAALNESWKFFSLPNNAQIQATVISIGSDSVLGTPDLVKTISLQAKNASGINIAYYLNQKTIKLSQHYGFSKMLNIYAINDSLKKDTTVYTLAGKTSPVMGIQPFNWADAYNFQVGDIFHYLKENTYGPIVIMSWKTIKRILQKTTSSNGNVISYLIEKCQLFEYYPIFSITFDTVTESYDLQALSANDTSLQRLPGEFHRYGGAPGYSTKFLRILNYNGRPEQIYTNLFYICYNPDCWYTVGSYSGSLVREQYSPGLGRTLYRSSYFYPSNASTETLVYFRKGSETWGTPIYTDCNTMVGTENKTPPEVIKITINPNPVTDKASISIPGFIDGRTYFMVLNDQLGQQIRKQAVQSNPFIFQKIGIKPGLYFISVMDDHGTVSSAVKMLIE